MNVDEQSLERVRKALRHLLHGLTPYVEERMKARYGVTWLCNVSGAANGEPRIMFDEYTLLKTMIDNWQAAFADGFSSIAERQRARNFVSSALEARNAVAHAAADLDDAAALRYLNACHELLGLATAPTAEIAEAKRLYDQQRYNGVTVPQPMPSRRNQSGSPRAGTVAEHLLDYIRRHPALDDDELARNLGKRREHINQAARRLEDQGLIHRDDGPRGKIVNRAAEERR